MGDRPILSTLPAESIDCGPVRIHWLTARAAVADAAIDALLTPDERAEAARMKAPLRLSEYRRARWLVRTLTGCREALPRQPSGEPTWPEGLVGSITHKRGAVGVAVDEADRTYGLGIDAEDAARVDPRIEPKIVSPAEAPRLGELVDRRLARDRGAALAIVFACKEALFKACFPRGRTMFFFHDATVVSVEPGVLTLRLERDVGPKTPRGAALRGHYTIREESDACFVLAAVHIPNP